MIKTSQTCFFHVPDTSGKFRKKKFFESFWPSKKIFFENFWGPNFSGFYLPDPQTWSTWPSSVSRKFSRDFTPIMWVCKTFSRIRAFKRTLSRVPTTHTDETAPYILIYCKKRRSEAPIQFYLSNCGFIDL